MGAHEEQDESVVSIVSGCVSGCVSRERQTIGRQHLLEDGVLAPPACLFGSQQVGESPRGDGDEPGLGAFVWRVDRLPQHPP